MLGVWFLGYLLYKFVLECGWKHTFQWIHRWSCKSLGCWPLLDSPWLRDTGCCCCYELHIYLGFQLTVFVNYGFMGVLNFLEMSCLDFYPVISSLWKWCCLLDIYSFIKYSMTFGNCQWYLEMLELRLSRNVVGSQACFHISYSSFLFDILLSMFM